MIVFDFCLLCLLIYLLYFTEKDLNKKYILKNKKQIKTIENLELFNNNDNKNNDNKNYIKNNIKLNDYNIEVDRPIYSCSNYKNDKNINFSNLDEELITNVYDKLVDDNRIQNVNYEMLENYYNDDKYYNIANNDNYGYTNFMTYKK
jgi:hypothetical protein